MAGSGGQPFIRAPNEPFQNVDLSGSDTITLSLSTEGQAVLRLSRIYVWQDTDGDGLSDRRERVGVYVPGMGEVTADPAEDDTDGDGLADGSEILGGVARGYGWIRVANSHPRRDDTDFDGLGDESETNGLSMSIMERPEGGYYELAEGSHSNGEIRVDPKPMDEDSDDDGLNDGPEVEYFNTDPTEDVTYEITRRHQSFIEELDKRRLAVKLDIFEGSASCGLNCLELDDGSDDFDFVMVPGSNPRERVIFTALDGTERSDMWLNSTEELHHGTDPWDPDTDDDGLTDGQEAIEITYDNSRRLFGDILKTDPDYDEYDFNPTVADSDDDGYWDGWIGVYGVGRTDNVVLYRHNLNTGNVIDRTNAGRPIRGLSADQRVKEQSLVHDVESSHNGADIDSDDTIEHSHVHIGELQWEYDPNDDTSIPSPSMIMEVDYYEDVNYSDLNSEKWERGVRRNLGLYGIDLEIRRNDPFTLDDIENSEVTFRRGVSIATEDEEPAEFRLLRDERLSEDADIYMFVGPRVENNRGTGPFYHSPTSSIIVPAPVFRSIIADEVTISVSQTKFNSEMEVMGTYMTLHEIGHHMCVGLADDRPDPEGRFNCDDYTEVRSGRNDQTREVIANRQRRSIMASGLSDQIITGPMEGDYFIYSIEELTTIQEP